MASALAACQGFTTVDATPCPAMPLADGEVWVGQLVCRDQRFQTSGDGDAEDYWMANSRFRAVLRHPAASLSLPGLGGGTLIDVAPWDRADVLYEAAPLIDGGWLDVDDLEVRTDRIVLRGTLRSLPDRPDLPLDDEVHEVSWRIAPDDPWLYLEGADGLWLHPAIEMDLLDGWLVSDQVVLGHDGRVEEDLGGALRIADLSALLIAHPSVAWAERPGPLTALSGTSAEAEQVRLYSQGAWVGTVPVDPETGAWQTVAPASIDTVRAIAAGRAPSAPVPAGEGVFAPIGPGGAVELGVGWTGGRSRRVHVAWNDGDLRHGEAVLAPEGGTLRLGAGAFDLQLSAGPAFASRELRVEIGADEVVPLRTSLRPALDPGSRVLAALSWQGARSRHRRVAPADRLRRAVGEGLEFIVSTVEDDIDTVEAYLDDRAWIRWEEGVAFTPPEAWRIVSWPWSSDARRSGHGVPRVLAGAPLEAHEAAWGGAGTQRHTMVDLDWLKLAQAPVWAIDPRPTYVALPSPGFPPHRAWEPWFAWLDAGRFLLPAGPTHWLDVGVPDRYGPVELQRALNYGTYCTGTGAVLQVEVDGVGPGLIVPPAEPDDSDDTHAAGGTDAPRDTEPPTLPIPRLVTMSLQPGTTGVRHVTLYSGDLGILGTWDTGATSWTWSGELLVGTWLVALGWSDNAVDWVVTAPVWIDPPTLD